MLVVPGLRAEDLTRPELKALESLVQKGGYGWMNARTARVNHPTLRGEDGRGTLESACLTINAGSRAAVPEIVSDYDSSALLTIREQSRILDHPVPIGALGDLLRSAGLRTDVAGNADDSRLRDLGRLLLMDSSGVVDSLRSNEDTLIRDADSPFGVRANPDIYVIRDGFALQAWVFGDVWRAEQYAPLSLPAMARKHRAVALTRLGGLVTQAAQIGDRAAFLLIGPAAAPSTPKVDRLAPVLRFGYGARPGLIYSPSTRTPGLITSTDLLPTIADYFGLRPPSGMVGRPVAIRPHAENEGGLRNWAGLHENWLIRSLKQSAFGGLPVLQFLLLLAAGIALTLSRLPNRERLQRIALGLAVSLSVLPTAQLLLPPVLLPFGVAVCGVVLAAVLLAAGVATAAWPNSGCRIATIFLGSMLLALGIDLLIGQPLLRQAWMSYSVMEGARYYGIGNEYAGAALGALGGFWLLSRLPATALGGGFLILGALCGLPNLGADAGAMLALILAAAAVLACGFNGRARARALVIILGAAIGLMAVVILIDSLLGSGAQSHLWRAFDEGIGSIASRKLALNLSLLFNSPWSLCLLTAGVGLWVLCRRVAVEPRVQAIRAGLLVGTLAILVFNDSGVVAAASSLILWFCAEALTAGPSLRAAADS